MNVTEEFYKTGVVPVVVIEDAENAVLTAKALLAGAEKNPFIAPEQWTDFLDHIEQKLNQLLEDPAEQV